MGTVATVHVSLGLGDKPTLEGCDFESEKFERELEAWHERKRKLDDEQRRRNEAEAAANGGAVCAA